MNFRKVFLSVAAATALAAPALAGAQTRFGQSFFAPATPNTKLVGVSAVSIAGTDTSPYQFDIFEFNGTNPFGPSLYNESLGLSFSGFSVSPNVDLTAGLQYAFVITGGGGRSMSRSADLFPGIAFICFGSDCGISTTQADITGTVITFAGATTVAPEPGTWALSGFGLLLIGAAARRRTNRR